MLNRVYVITWQRTDGLDSPPIRCLSLIAALAVVDALLCADVRGVYAVTVTTAPPIGGEEDG